MGTVRSFRIYVICLAFNCFLVEILQKSKIFALFLFKIFATGMILTKTFCFITELRRPKSSKKKFSFAASKLLAKEIWVWELPSICVRATWRSQKLVGFREAFLLHFLLNCFCLKIFLWSRRKNLVSTSPLLNHNCWRCKSPIPGVRLDRIELFVVEVESPGPYIGKNIEKGKNFCRNHGHR